MRFATLAAVLSIAGCEFYTQEEHYGVFTLTRDMMHNKLDWEGGNSSMVGIRLCSSVDGRCFKAEGISVLQPRDRTRRHGRIAVWQSGSWQDDHFPSTLSFHDTVTGKQLSCSNCTVPVEPLLTSYGQDKYARFEWGHTGAVGVGHFPQGESDTGVILLQFEDNGYRATYLGRWPTAQLQTGSLTFSPAEDALGWYVCTETCELFAYELESHQLGAVDVACAYNSYLNIGWLGTRAYPEHYWGTSPDNRCLTPDGVTALPRGKGDDLQRREDDPPHPVSVEELPELRVVGTVDADGLAGIGH